MLFLVLIALLKQNITAFFSARTSEDPSLCKYIFLREGKKRKEKNKQQEPHCYPSHCISSGGYKLDLFLKVHNGLFMNASFSTKQHAVKECAT